MVQASVEEVSGYWRKTAAYTRLDPSEKSAVSYFLGMTQAKITCELLLGIPHLVHLDAILKLLEVPMRTSRPDLVGYDAFTNTFSVAVEAKGRSAGRDDEAIEKAKKQAGLMPSIVGVRSKVCVASLAYFDGGGRWQAYLEDPEGSYSHIEDVEPPTLLVSYYRPLVASMLEAGISESQSSDTELVANLPGIDMQLGLPRAIVESFDDIPLTGQVGPASLRAGESRIIAAVRELFGRVEVVAALDYPDVVSTQSTERRPDHWESITSADAEDPTTCTGLDGVRVTLGSSWFN